MTAERKYTTRQVSEKLGVRTSTVRRWIRQGKLPAIGDQQHRRIRASDLEKIMAELADD